MPSSRPAGLGIDLGTSHTVAVVRRRDGRVQSLLFDSSPLLPSAVFVSQGGVALVGSDALHSAKMAPARLEPHPKRRIDDGTVLLGDREWTIPELFAAVLSRVRRECVQVMGEIPSEVVITHPAVWGPTRRSLLRKACAAAGFEDVGLVPEPVAASHYFVDQLGHEVPVGASIVVHDFGGGTFDAAVLTRTITGFTVSSLDGLDQLGGTDIDAAIIADLRGRVGDPDDWAWYTVPQTTADRRARHNFIEDVRLVKERLSRHPTADLYLPILDRDVHLTREELETLARPLLSRAVDVVEAVIEDSGVPDLAGIFLVGGASRMPLVATLLHRRLGVAPIVVDQLEQVVAHGALLSEEPEVVGSALPISEEVVGRAIEPDVDGSASGGSSTVADTVHGSEGRTAEAPTVEDVATQAEEISEVVSTPTHVSGAEPADPVTVVSVESDDDAKTSRPTVSRRSILATGIGTITALAAIPLVMALNQEDDPVHADDAPSTSPRSAAQGWRSETMIEDVFVRALAFSPDGRTLAMSRAKAVELWDVSGVRLDIFETERRAEGSTDQLRFSPDGDLLVLARNGVIVWNTADGELIDSWEGDRGTAIAFSPDGTFLAFSDRKKVSYWVAGTQTVVDRWNALRSSDDSAHVGHLVFSPAGELLVSTGSGVEGSIEVWRRSNGARVIQLGAPSLWRPAVFSPDGSLLAGCGTRGVQVWRVVDWSRLQEMDPNWAGTLLEFSPDGRTLLTDGIKESSGQMRLWEVTSGLQTRDDLTHQDGKLTAATFSPKGNLIASGSNQSVKLWRRD